MVTLHFFNSSNINVKIRTNISKLPASGLSTFTIEKVEGIDTAQDKVIFEQFKIGIVEYTLGDMRVLATNNALNLNIVEESVKNAIVKLGTPGSFAGTVNSATQITLNWNAVTNANQYVLQRSTNSGFTANLVTSYLPPSTTKVVTGLTTATAYYFRLKAIAPGYLDSEFATDNKTTS